MNIDTALFKLTIGSSFTFRNIHWEVVEAYRYDWDEDDYSLEFKVKSGEQEAYLGLEEDDEEIMIVNFSTEVDHDELKPMISIDDFFGEDVITNIEYLASEYALDEICEGYFTDLSGKEEEMAFINHCYYKDQYYVNIDVWADNTLDCSVGEAIDKLKITNIEHK